MQEGGTQLSGSAGPSSALAHQPPREIQKMPAPRPTPLCEQPNADQVGVGGWGTEEPI